MSTTLIPQGAKDIIKKLQDNNHEAYLVGGCVRDMLLGIPPNDWDICTDARPEEVLELFKGTNRVIPTGLQHGTVTVLSDEVPYEVTTYRVDGEYEDHRRPATVSYTSNLIEDLARRDFTVNAMAYSPTVGLIDPYGGREDLNLRLLRCVGRPEDRFNEDSLRILRALRFAAVKGFRLEAGTEQAIYNLYSLMETLSAERVLSEILQLLVGDSAYTVLMKYAEIITYILPELKPMYGCEQNNPHHKYDVYEHTCAVVSGLPKNEVLRVAALFHDAGKPSTKTTEDGIDHFYGHPEVSIQLVEATLKRLKASNALIEGVSPLIKYHDAELPNRRSVRRMVNKIGKEKTYELLYLKEADALAQTLEYLPDKLLAVHNARKVLSELEAEDACFGLKDLAVSGADLLNSGFVQGKQVGETLKHLLNQVLDEVLSNDRDTLLKEALKFKDRKAI